MKSKDLEKLVLSKCENGDRPAKIFEDLNGTVSEPTIKRWCKRIHENHTIDLRYSPDRKRPAQMEGNTKSVKKLLKGKKPVTTRKLAAKFEISRISVHRMLKLDLGCYTYKKRMFSCRTKQERNYRCQRCLNHGKSTYRKGHVCEYKSCKCALCNLNYERRKITNALRKNRNDTVSGTISDCNSRQQRCVLCRNHGHSATLKNHKPNCPYKNCTCRTCSDSKKHRRVMAAQTKNRRRQLGSMKKSKRFSADCFQKRSTVIRSAQKSEETMADGDKLVTNGKSYNSSSRSSFSLALPVMPATLNPVCQIYCSQLQYTLQFLQPFYPRLFAPNKFYNPFFSLFSR